MSLLETKWWSCALKCPYLLAAAGTLLVVVLINLPQTKIALKRREDISPNPSPSHKKVKKF